MSLHLDSICLCVADLENSLTFYTLGFGLHMHNREGKKAVLVGAKGCALQLFESGTALAITPGENGVLRLQMASFDSHVERLRDQGAAIVGPVAKSAQGAVQSLLDPDENLIQLVEKPHTRLERLDLPISMGKPWLVVGSRERALDFYVGLLGGRLLGERTSRMEFDGFTVSFQSLPLPFRAGMNAILPLLVQDFEQSYKRLMHYHPKLLGGRIELPEYHTRLQTLCDPDGNIVQLMQAHT